MWNRRQKKFQDNVSLHVIQSLPHDSVCRSVEGTEVYCHPSKEIACKGFLASLFVELGFTRRSYLSMLKKIMGAYPRAY